MFLKGTLGLTPGRLNRVSPLKSGFRFFFWGEGGWLTIDNIYFWWHKMRIPLGDARPTFFGSFGWVKGQQVFQAPRLKDGSFTTTEIYSHTTSQRHLQHFLVACHSAKGCLTSIFWVLGLREGKSAFEGSKAGSSITTKNRLLHFWTKKKTLRTFRWRVTMLAMRCEAHIILGTWAGGREVYCLRLQVWGMGDSQPEK